MGYAFDKKTFKSMDSDNAAGLSEEICEAIVGKLRKAEKLKDNEHNTDGVINVALFLQELETPDYCNYAIQVFLTGFVVRFQKYIAKEENSGDWDCPKNKQNHVRRFKSILANLENKLKTMK
jgi:hypothetical protein